MPDPTAEFFDRLAGRARDPLLEPIEGTLRLDLATDREIIYWTVRIGDATFQVSNTEDEANCVAYTTKARFDQIATGTANLIAMFLRGELVVHGDMHLLIALERCLPGPPGVHGPRRPARSGDRR